MTDETVSGYLQSSLLSTDVLIIGAGPVGMTLALALADSSLHVLLLDRQPAGSWLKDPRALAALSHGTRQLLERLNTWNAAAATAIQDIHVSQRVASAAQINAADYDIPALGYVGDYRDLLSALHARIGAGRLIAPCSVRRIDTGESHVTATITHQGATRRIASTTGRACRRYAAGRPGVLCATTSSTPSSAKYARRPSPTVPGNASPRTARWPCCPSGGLRRRLHPVPPGEATQITALGDPRISAGTQRAIRHRLELVATSPRASFPLALRPAPAIDQDLSHEQQHRADAASGTCLYFRSVRLLLGLETNQDSLY